MRSARINNIRQTSQRRTVTSLQVAGESIPLELGYNPRARRYLLRIRCDGSLRITIPRHGMQEEALAFAERKAEWIAHHRSRLMELVRKPVVTQHGSIIWFRGEQVSLSVQQLDEGWSALFQKEMIFSPVMTKDWRPLINSHLRKLAQKELPSRVMELAKLHALEINRVSIRDQRSRWGSCSVRRTISLNWRLIQAPVEVLDYVIIHELMHLREMNHSARYWKLVAEACPDYQAAESWLKRFGRELRQ